ncbi:MAG: mannitol dehydrogenase [Ruminococcaceae bacterium]|nr:mannitol dehydrogenase [Oscillospiraceae bacterium]
MKKAVMYGAGNIGRGFMGQLFCMSQMETVFIDINEVVVNKLNTDKSYPIFITKNGEYEEFTVTNARAVNGKVIENVAKEIATADVMATAVGVNILPYIVKPIAAGIKARMLENPTELNIIICENKIGADKYLRELISKELTDEENKFFNEKIGLVEASIGRMVPATPKEIAEKNPLSVCVEEFCTLPVDKEAFKGEIPDIKNMLPFAPFELFIQRKLYMHNMSHALSAYLGYLKDYKFIYEAQNNMAIKFFALGALIESATALSIEHKVDIIPLIQHAYDLLGRFENVLLGDTIERVGKDTIRKLSTNDRMAGAAKLCAKNGIKPVYIALGLAAGLLFEPEADEAAKEVAAFTRENGVRKALEKYSEITDETIVSMVEKNYEMLKTKGFDDFVFESERLKGC